MIYDNPYIPTVTFMARFSCSIPWYAPIAENGTPVLFTEKLPFEKKSQTSECLSCNAYILDKIHWNFDGHKQNSTSLNDAVMQDEGPTTSALFLEWKGAEVETSSYSFYKM